MMLIWDLSERRDSWTQGSPAVSMQWGAWGGTGMAASDTRLLAALARAGMGAVLPPQGLAALSGVLTALQSSRMARAGAASRPVI